MQLLPMVHCFSTPVTAILSYRLYFLFKANHDSAKCYGASELQLKCSEAERLALSGNEMRIKSKECRRTYIAFPIPLFLYLWLEQSGVVALK